MLTHQHEPYVNSLPCLQTPTVFPLILATRKRFSGFEKNILKTPLNVLIATLSIGLKTNKSDKKGLEKRTSAIDNLLFCG